MDKATLRRELTAERRAFAKRPDITEKNNAITGRFLAFYDAFRRETGKDAPTVFCYVGCGWEVATRDILTALLASNAVVTVPRCRTEGQMDAVVITSLTDLHAGMYGLLEPDEDLPRVCPDGIDLCVVPATAYDRRGHRLGRGGGYYDRFLANLRPDCVTVGLMYDDFILPEVPTGEYDRPVGRILTEGHHI